MIVSLLFFLIVKVFWFIVDVLYKGCFSQNLSKGEIIRFVDYNWPHFVKTSVLTRLFRFLGRFGFHVKSLKICLKIWFMWLVLQEACVSRSFLCRFKAAIYLNYISKIDLVKIYFVKIAVENIRDLFQIHFCASRRLLLKIYFWAEKIFLYRMTQIYL